MMEKDRDKMVERLINLTLEILFQLTGEDYIVVKKISSGRHQALGCEGSGRTLSPILGPHPDSLIHEEINEQKVLELTNKMVELLTGEVPIRCQDVAVYFSMEEWEHLEGHKDQYKDIVMMEDQQPLTSQDDCTRSSEGHLISSYFNNYDHGIKQKTCDEYAIIQDTPSAIHSEDLSSDTIIQVLYSGSSQAVEQQRSHKSEKQFSCSECGKCFTLRKTLVTHQKIHTGEKPFLCSECGKSFIQKSDLRRHQRIHTGEKLFSCSECRKVFVQKSALVIHQRNHSGAKPFLCMECGKCFNQKSDLARHQRIHTKGMQFPCSQCGKCHSENSVKKPFSCSECCKSFSRISGLARHQRIHTGTKPFSCSECGKCFSQKSNLERHQKSHKGEKPYSCSECGKGFTHKSYLFNHQIAHSGNQAESELSNMQCAQRYT